MAHFNEQELIETGIASLAGIFGLDPKQLDAETGDGAGDRLGQGSLRARRLFLCHARRAARHGPRSQDADDRPIRFSGEAIYGGPEVGTVEAALASGLETAQAILEPN